MLTGLEAERVAQRGRHVERQRNRVTRLGRHRGDRQWMEFAQCGTRIAVRSIEAKVNAA
jgi:hypothetical protein